MISHPTAWCSHWSITSGNCLSVSTNSWLATTRLCGFSNNEYSFHPTMSWTMSEGDGSSSRSVQHIALGSSISSPQMAAMFGHNIQLTNPSGVDHPTWGTTTSLDEGRHRMLDTRLWISITHWTVCLTGWPIPRDPCINSVWSPSCRTTYTDVHGRFLHCPNNDDHPLLACLGQWFFLSTWWPLETT